MKRPTSNDFVLVFRTYWSEYDVAIQSYCNGLECEKADLEVRLKQTENLLRNILNKLYRLDFSKSSRIALLIEELEEALKKLKEA